MPVLSRRTSILAPVSRITWSAAALLIATSCKPDAPTQTPTPVTEPVSTQEPDPLRDLDADIAETMDLLEVPGLAIAIVKDDQVVLARGYGIREHGKDDRVDADTVFAIASNTKAFVATTVGLLVADGQLDWDDRVTEHLPELKLWDEYTTSHIKVRDLLSHRSGLSTWAGDLAWIGSKIQTDELVARLQFVPADHDFRERYGYTNLMYVLAGQVIEAKTGKPWHAVVKERLLDPLGMKRTVVTVDALPQMENVATPHMGRGEKRTVIPYLDVDNAGAAGALNSSVADMARWLRMQLGDGTLGEQSIVPETVIAATREPHTIVPHKGPAQPPQGSFVTYGLGWVLFDYDGRLVVTHSGGLPGMISRVILVPEEDLGVVVLTNSESPAASIVASGVVDRFLGIPPQDRLGQALAKQREKDQPEDVPEPPSRAEPSIALKGYTGTYRHPLLGKAEVKQDGDGLSLDLVDHGDLRCRLAHTDADTFDCTWEDPIFERSDVHFEVKGRRATELRFKVRPEFVDPLEYRFTRS